MTPARRGIARRDPVFWLATAVTARHAVGAWQLRRSLAFLRDTDPQPPTDVTVRHRIHVVVPALREQAHIAAAMRWFAAVVGELPGSTLTVVTTAREERERAHLADLVAACAAEPITARRFPQLTDAQCRALTAGRAAAGGVLTARMAADILDRFPLTRDVAAATLAELGGAGAAVGHLTYPGQGRKAAQVNYAVARLDAADHDYVAVYDVDSRPDPQLMRRTLQYAERRRVLDGRPPAVIQQPARFAVVGAGGHGWERALCRGAAQLQTLWTLRREIPSFRRYATATRHPTGRPLLDAAARGLAQTVGHGLLVRVDVYRHVGGLPEFTVLDDLPFGYRLTVAAIPVDVVPAVTDAPAPEHLSDLITTHRRWFRNYLDYPACASAARGGGHGTPAARVVALGVAGYRAASWVLASPATAGCLIAAVRPKTATSVRILAAVGLWLGCVTPIHMLAAAAGRRPGLAEQTRDSAGLLGAYLVKSVGPIMTLIGAAARGAPTRALSPKTERRYPSAIKEPR